MRSLPLARWEVNSDGSNAHPLLPGCKGDPPSNGTIDTLASLKSFRPVVDEDTDKWLSVSAGGSPVLTRDIGTQEIYDLNIRWALNSAIKLERFERAAMLRCVG